MKEIWKDIKNYEGYYQISNCGNVKSLSRSKSFSEKILSNNKNTSGYYHVKLCNWLGKKTHMIHRLVAQSFISNPENKRTVNHKDSNKENNNVNNLEWATYSENHIHSYKNGRLGGATGKLGYLNKNSIEVGQYSLDGEFITRYGGINEAGRKTSIFFHSISKACNGKYKTAGGFLWRKIINNDISDLIIGDNNG